MRLICNNVNLGIHKTRTKGVMLTQGEYLAMLNSHDIVYPARLEKQVEFLDHHPDYVIVGTWRRAWMHRVALRESLEYSRYHSKRYGRGCCFSVLFSVNRAANRYGVAWGILA